MGEKLLHRIDAYIEIIKMNPYIFREDYKKIWQVRVKPFKYILRYKIYKNHVAVIQLFFGKQHPSKKKNKV